MRKEEIVRKNIILERTLQKYEYSSNSIQFTFENIKKAKKTLQYTIKKHQPNL